MKHLILTGTLVFGLASCGTGNPSASTQQSVKTSDTSATADRRADSAAPTGSNVPYVEAKNYFVNNNLDTLPPTKITTQAEFDRCFGMATTMGDDGQPTTIDFAKQFVIALSQKPTDRAAELRVLSLVEDASGKLRLRYRYTEGKKQGFTTQPLVLLIVDRSHEGDVVLEAQR